MSDSAVKNAVGKDGDGDGDAKDLGKRDTGKLSLFRERKRSSASSVCF